MGTRLRAVSERRTAGRFVLAALYLLGVVLWHGQPARADGGYVVQDGDTLSGIANSFGVTLQDLIWLNGISDPDVIYPGQYLAVSSDTSTDAATTPDDNWSGDVPADASTYVDPATVSAYLTAAAREYGWNPNFIKAVAWQESGWQQDVVSWVGAVGVMQLMPSTAAWLNAAYFPDRELDVQNSAWDNIEAGVAYLSALYDQTGSAELTLAGYYQGLGSVEAEGVFPETEAYVTNIIELRDAFAAGALP